MNLLKNCTGAILMLVAAVLTGCMGTAGYRDPGNPVDFPYHQSAYDLQVGWKPVLSGTDLHIEGVLRNVRFFQVRDLDVTVYLYDRNGILKGKGGDLPLPVPVAQGDVAEFDVKLGTVTISPGDRLEFKVIYYDLDGDRGGDMKVRYFSAPAPLRP
jgi:hypothetical protein